MITTTSSISVMALLLIVLLPTIIASSSINSDEKSAVEIESSHLRKRMVVSEDRELAQRGSSFTTTSIALPQREPVVDVATPTPAPKVITLGDSYSSGIGIHRDGCDYDVEFGGNPTLGGITYDFTAHEEHACWMEQQTTPGPRYASAMGQESVFLGCGGAQVPQVNSQLDYLLAAYPVDRANNFQGSTILFTIGGNDILTNDGKTWPELLEHCILELSLFYGCHDWTKNYIANFAAIQSDLADFYTRLANEASGAKIRVLGYPKIMQRDPGCSSVTGLSRDEADWIDVQCDNLNNSLISAVNTVKTSHPSVDIEFVNVYNYITIGACGNGASNRQVNDKILHSYFPWGTSNSSFHPSQKGYNKYYHALLNSL